MPKWARSGLPLSSTTPPPPDAQGNCPSCWGPRWPMACSALGLRHGTAGKEVRVSLQSRGLPACVQPVSSIPLPGSCYYYPLCRRIDRLSEGLKDWPRGPADNDTSEPGLEPGAHDPSPHTASAPSMLREDPMTRGKRQSTAREERKETRAKTKTVQPYFPRTKMRIPG